MVLKSLIQVRLVEMLAIVFVIGVLYSVMSCSKIKFSKTKTSKGIFELTKENDSLYYLSVQNGIPSQKWKLPYPVYQFDIGDIDHNGVEDALIGVIKPTRFDSLKNKRLFIFKNYKGLVRPLWLGSRLGQPLVDFKCKKKEDRYVVRSVEREKSGKYLVVEYKWRKFGLEFIKYLKRETDSLTAFDILMH